MIGQFPIVREVFLHLPLIGRFALIFGLVMLLPRIAERLRLPGVVGLLVGGIVLGPELLGLVDPKNGTIQLFAELGKLLLLFFAGYEVELDQFRRMGKRSGVFGLLTFGIPMAVGGGVAHLFGYGLNASILIGSLLASHTLLALPIVKSLGLMGRDSVVLAIGATMFTDIAALLTLAVCLPVHVNGFEPHRFGLTLLGLALYVPLVTVGLPKLVRLLSRVVHLSEDGDLGVLLLAIASAAFVAEEIGLEGIVGAFLIGLGMKMAFRRSLAENTLSVISHALFIPVFFLSIGFIVSTRIFIHTVAHDGLLVSAIVGGLLAAKYVAARLSAAAFRMNRDDALLMWSLSVPQVAATLAAALVAYGTMNADGRRLIDERILNTVVVLVLVTSIVGPVISRSVGSRIAGQGDSQPGSSA